MSRYFNFGLLLVGLTEKSVYGYDTGEDITLCWVWQPNDLQGSNTSARSNFKSYAPVREECGDFDVVVVWPAAMFESTRVSFETTFYTPLLSPPAYAPPAEEAPNVAIGIMSSTPTYILASELADASSQHRGGTWASVPPSFQTRPRSLPTRRLCTDVLTPRAQLTSYLKHPLQQVNHDIWSKRAVQIAREDESSPSCILCGQLSSIQVATSWMTRAFKFDSVRQGLLLLLCTGVYTIISHVSYYDTAGRRHDASRAYFADVLKKETADYRVFRLSRIRRVELVISFACIFAFFFLVGLVWFGRAVLHWRRAAKQARRRCPALRTSFPRVWLIVLACLCSHYDCQDSKPRPLLAHALPGFCRQAD
eukprot:6205636-Pleurochrysis_carterae.AAC.8